MFRKRVLPILLSLALTASSALSVAYAVETSNETEAEQPVPQTVNFTNAGPFLPVTLAEEPEEKDALKLDKKVTDNGDGSYKITMEAYTTGTVTTTTSTKPVDIVLVLDQSGSMAYDWNGDSTWDWTTSRQHSLIQSVNSFIDSVKEKYDAEESDHRMALVQFGSDAEVMQNWTFVDENGAAQLHSDIDGLPHSPSGATRIDRGMSEAETLMGDGYSYNGENDEDRQKVVILFTDGVPTTQSDFDTGVANTAITSALNLKNNDVTVYSIGIFQGANPDQLYGDKWGYTWPMEDVECTGAVGSYWGGSFLSGLFGGNDFEAIDIAAGNRFLNYLSNNFAAENIGLDRGTFHPNQPDWNLAAYGTGYKITDNFERIENQYYLTAADSESLNDIFETISDNISSSTVDLNEKTQIIDTVTPYFDMPENPTDIKLYTQQAGPGGSFVGTSPVEVTDGSITAAMDGRKVTVTGFNFNEEFVTEEEKEPASGNYGSKLIIKFNITRNENFFGGNNVPTNESNSGVYAPDTSTPTGTFDIPHANVPIKYAIDGEDQTIFLGETADLSQTVDFVEGYVPNGTNNDYVNIVYTLTDPETEETVATCTFAAGATEGTWNWITDQDPALTADKEYKLTCTVSPTVEKEQDCDVGAPQDSTEYEPENEPTVFVKSGTLTITKNMADGTTADSGERFVFNIKKDGQDYMTVALGANETVEIKNLPKGTYVVDEDTSWSWRFTSSITDNEVEIDMDTPNGSVTCTNERTKEKWLNKYEWVINDKNDGNTEASEKGGSEA